MTLIYDVKVIPVIFINSQLFFQTQGERMKKIDSILSEIFDFFTFFMQSIFHLEKED